ncbi:hypothetical protein A2344_03290 [Candidatus Peregrinibacteria bacterium RIFOXYB12_FULL_41_12]|nr:MAG: hypothetical protein A2344_03290 [Candidatus Peregrinibacteria bacterium RIFOXYB12_FULL_41_12]
MRVKKYIVSVLLGLMSALIFPIFAANAADISIDLIPDEAEDALCEGLDEATGEIISCSETSGDITSFTEYDGSFEAPDASGYDSGLTKATSAREFILNVTNFALSFLGLVAVVVIIYGGFLYVTAAGEEEKSGKGKKAVMYAIIGIIIVLASYAIVNTLIGEAAGGGEDRGGGIYSTGEGVSGSEVSTYNVNYIADELQSIAAEYVDVFTVYSNVYSYVKYANGYEVPSVDQVITLFTNDEPVDEDSVREIREYLEIINQVAVEIQNTVDQYSDTYETAEKMKDYTDKMIELAQPTGNYSSSVFGIGKAYAAEQEYYDYNDFEDYGDKISGYLDDLKSSANSDFNEYMDDYYDRLDAIYSMFDVENLGDSGSTLITIKTAIGNSRDMFSTGGTPASYQESDATSFVANSVLRDVVADLGELYTMVKDLQFVTASIEASVSEGNSPLVVSFNGLASYDPSEKTIQDNQYHWNLDGNDDYDESDEPQAATVSYTFTDPGTYRVGLRVTSQDTDVAPGQGYISITVYPPESNIVLTAVTSEGEEVEMANYEEGLSKDKVKFTESEALGGITFSLDGTTDGNGDPTVYHTLDCGNGETYEGESVITTAVCTYDQRGTYSLNVEVTDVIGNTDRYMADIIVASPAARGEASLYSASMEDVIKFKSASKTDIGSIVSEIWTASLDGVEVDLGQGSEVDYQLPSPGKWNISLSVRDSSNEEDTDTIEIVVESTPPIAQFTYDIPDPTQPGTVHFNASGSSDPDKGDDISAYLWTFEGDYTFVEDTDATSEKPVVKFTEEGVKNVTLTVTDNYEITTTTEKDVDVASVLDIDLEMPMGVAYQLDDETGEAEVLFNAISENAIAFEIDYGDGETEADESGGEVEFTHTYKTTGSYYVELIAYDENDNENSYTKKVYIGDSNSTIAVVSIQKDGSDIATSDITGNTNTVFTFDASESKNSNGTSRNLTYSWDFGDNTRSTDKRENHTYEDIGTYTLKLTVSDENDPTITSEDSYTITIEEEPAIIYGLTYTISSDSLTTPVNVIASVDAEDPDGTIEQYYWYYYDTANTTEEMGNKITSRGYPEASFTIPTNGSTGEEKGYAFVVEITDSGGNKVSSQDFLAEDPVITVENGQNESPEAKFTVDDTAIMLGETVTLSSISSDPEGGSMTYMWDTEGDGFTNNTETDSATYGFTPTAIGCFDIKLKVTDDMGQSAVSKATEVCVESISEPPEAAFTYKVGFDDTGFEVEFTNNSKFDTVNGAEPYAYQWDFDSAVDSDGNGNRMDDIDSQEENPLYSYDAIGSYTVSLTVYDTAGETDSVQNSITISDTDPPTAAFKYTTNDLTVKFTDNSETADDSIDVVSYIWDFDEATDSSGDGDKTNDVDSTEADPEYAYEAYGKYAVRLTVLDAMNKEDFVTRTVDVSEPTQEIIAYMSPNPAASPSDGKIHISGTSGKVDISYSTNLTSGEGITCWLDKNVYYDTNGDGLKDNDHDYEDKTCLSGTWTAVSFDQSWGMIVIMLTAEDSYGNSYEVTKEITFDATTGGANIFPVSGVQGLVLIMVAFSFALLGVSIYTVKKID